MANLAPGTFLDKMLMVATYVDIISIKEDGSEKDSKKKGAEFGLSVTYNRFKNK